MNPQEIFRRRKFKRVVLDPPNFNPGSWRGAGKLLVDDESGEYWLTSRPRTAETRGYAAEIFRSSNGEDFHLVSLVHKDELSRFSGTTVFSIENNQLLRDPLTGRYHLYLSINVGKDRPERWETYLVTAEDPRGPWEPHGFVIRADQPYDSAEARDCTIDVLDGLYLALCKARADGSEKVRTEALVSKDGKSWRKLGVPTVDGRSQDPNPAFLLNGDILPSVYGPMFVGTVTTFFRNAHLTKYVGAYVLNLTTNDLWEVFNAEWRRSSPFEREDFPIHTYCNVVWDPKVRRWRILVEAVDPVYTKELGVDTEVDRVLMYET